MIVADENPIWVIDDEVSDIKDESLIVKGTRTPQDSKCHVVVTKPSNFINVVSDENWKVAMDAKMSMILKNNTCILVDKPFDQHVIGVKWIFGIKLNPNGIVNKYKARLVVKGYAQVYGVDYFETFAPVARHDTIRLLVALSARENWKIFHLSVKSAFLDGVLLKDIYILNCLKGI